METLTVTLETAKKLKAAGFPQETFARYAEDEHLMVDYINSSKRTEWYEYDIAAPTAQEIADQLPGQWHIFKKPYLDGTQYTARASEIFSVAYTMAEALAALWLKLHEAD
jgi:hypothetical protein